MDLTFAFFLFFPLAIGEHVLWPTARANVHVQVYTYRFISRKSYRRLNEHTSAIGGTFFSMQRIDNGQQSWHYRSIMFTYCNFFFYYDITRGNEEDIIPLKRSSLSRNIGEEKLPFSILFSFLPLSFCLFYIKSHQSYGY